MGNIISLNTTLTKSMNTDIIWILEEELKRIEKKYEKLSGTDSWYVRESGHVQSMINKLLVAQGDEEKY